MASIQQDGIVLGPGNEIRPVPQNDPLLQELYRTHPLQVDQLLKLARFYEVYPGVAPLGKHSALVGLATQAGPQAVRQAFTDYGFLDLDEAWEYAVGLGHDYANDDPGDKPAAAIVSIKISIRQMVVNGIGLLIETFVSIDENSVESVRHFILGVAPTQADLEVLKEVPLRDNL